MLYRLSQKELDSLSRISRIDGGALEAILVAELGTVTKLIMDADTDAQWRQLQGRGQCLLALMDALKSARGKDAPL